MNRTNKHEPQDLTQLQSLPLEDKVKLTKARVEAWYEHFDGKVHLSFSGGKDSTVLKHIIDSMYKDVPAVFVDTGLEYPEIREFVSEVASGKHSDYFTPNVEIVRPIMKYPEVIDTYGYPVISKEVAHKVYDARRAIANGIPDNYAVRQFNGEYISSVTGKPNAFSVEKYKYLLDAPFKISHMCCAIMKERPAIMYAKKTNSAPIIGTMAAESRLRKKAWLMNGCNAFDAKYPKSSPISFWTEQDVLKYLRDNNIPYCKAYGYILPAKDKLITSGLNRTGCMFCMFGCHLETQPNRFQTMKATHPKQYEYCMKPTSEGGLGLREVLEYIGVKYE